MRLQVVRAIYKGGMLIFTQPEFTPRDGTEVILTYLEEGGMEEQPEVDPIQALRGRGKGERLVEKLLQARREDRQRDESSSTSHGAQDRFRWVSKACCRLTTDN